VRIHGAIVAATGRSDRRGDYTTGDRRSDNRQLVARLKRCSSPRRSLWQSRRRSPRVCMCPIMCSEH